LNFLESTFGPLIKIVQSLQGQPERLGQLRSELLEILTDSFTDNTLRQHFLMSRAVKK